MPLAVHPPARLKASVGSRQTEETALGSFNCPGDGAAARGEKRREEGGGEEEGGGRKEEQRLSVCLCHHLHNVMNRLIK